MRFRYLSSCKLVGEKQLHLEKRYRATGRVIFPQDKDERRSKAHYHILNSLKLFVFEQVQQEVLQAI